ncbi:MAG: tripartite tricarboxylate transporter permease [Nitrospinota bacterium]
MEEISGYSRFDFGLPELMHGISFIPVMIGLFAGSEVFRQVAQAGGARPLTRPISGALPYSALFFFLTVLGLSWPYLRELRSSRAARARPLS